MLYPPKILSEVLNRCLTGKNGGGKSAQGHRFMVEICMSQNDPFLKEIFPIEWSYKANSNEKAHKTSEVLNSLDEFSKEVLADQSKAKIEIGDLEIHRPGEEKIEIDQSFNDYLSQALYPSRLESKKNVQVIFLTESFLRDSKDPLQTCLSQASAELLSKMIQAMGLANNNYLITAVKSAENITEHDFLENAKKEAYFFNFPIIISLGAYTTQVILNSKERLSKVQGQVFHREWVYGSKRESIRVVPLFHPDFLLINPAMKRAAWEGMQVAMKLFTL